MYHNLMSSLVLDLYLPNMVCVTTLCPRWFWTYTGMAWYVSQLNVPSGLGLILAWRGMYHSLMSSLVLDLYWHGVVCITT